MPDLPHSISFSGPVSTMDSSLPILYSSATVPLLPEAAYTTSVATT